MRVRGHEAEVEDLALGDDTALGELALDRRQLREVLPDTIHRDEPPEALPGVDEAGLA